MVKLGLLVLLKELHNGTQKTSHHSTLKQKSKGGFKTKAEARDYAIKMEATALSGVDVTQNPVFADYYKHWYETFKFPSIRQSTKTDTRLITKSLSNFSD